jgi:molybdenum cofactor biosynthesis enzyme MoaA
LNPFKPTSELLHRLNHAVKNPRLKFAAILLADLFRIRHLIVRLDAVNACNLRCGMCFFSDAAWRKAHMKGQFTKPDIERLAVMFFRDALQVHFGCAMEPTMFRDYPWLIELAKRHRVPFVGFTTNGQILSETAYERMACAGLDEITVSTHGVRKETYESLMPGAAYERLLASLAMIAGINRKIGTGAPRLRLNYTICPANLEELDEFFEIYGRFGIFTLQLRPMADFGATTYADKDLRPHLSHYNAAIERAIAACKARNIILLANRSDPAHERPNPAASVYKMGILRYLNPNVVWRDDFEWRTRDYRDHKSRLGWRRQLLAQAIGFHRSEPAQSHQAIFEAF